MTHRVTNPLRYRIGRQVYRSKCFVLNRRGDGVHSPYAFRLIRQVLRNPHPYVAFDRLRNASKLERSKLRADYGHRLITQTKYLELIYRFVADSTPSRVTLYGAKESLLYTYLTDILQSDQVKLISSVESKDDSADLVAELIILEDSSPETLEYISQQLPSIAKSRCRAIIFNSYNPILRPLRQTLLKRLNPPIRFDLKGLEIWVWRQATTPGKYTVYV